MTRIKSLLFEFHPGTGTSAIIYAEWFFQIDDRIDFNKLRKKETFDAVSKRSTLFVFTVLINQPFKRSSRKSFNPESYQQTLVYRRTYIVTLVTLLCLNCSIISYEQMYIFFFCQKELLEHAFWFFELFNYWCSWLSNRIIGIGTSEGQPRDQRIAWKRCAHWLPLLLGLDFPNANCYLW